MSREFCARQSLGRERRGRDFPFGILRGLHVCTRAPPLCAGKKLELRHLPPLGPCLHLDEPVLAQFIPGCASLRSLQRLRCPKTFGPRHAKGILASRVRPQTDSKVSTTLSSSDPLPLLSTSLPQLSLASLVEAMAFLSTAESSDSRAAWHQRRLKTRGFDQVQLQDDIRVINRMEDWTIRHAAPKYI